MQARIDEKLGAFFGRLTRLPDNSFNSPICLTLKKKQKKKKKGKKNTHTVSREKQKFNCLLTRVVVQLL